MQWPVGPLCSPHLQSLPASQVSVVPAASSIHGTLLETLGPRWQELQQCWRALKEWKALPVPVLTDHFIMNPSDTQQGHPTGSKNEVLTEIWESAEIPSYTNPKRLTFKTGNKGPISCQQKGNSVGIVCVPQSKSRDGGSRGKTLLMSSWIPTGDCFGFQFYRSREWMLF